MKKYIFVLIMAIITFCYSVEEVKASSSVNASFAEIAQRSNLIFIGTVDKQANRVLENKRMAFTDVFFKDIEIISATARSKQKDSPTIRLSVAGGRIGDYYTEISGTPTFENGKRYLICAYDDGAPYMTPVVGDAMFVVIRDVESSEEYITDVGGRAIIGMDYSGFLTSGESVSQIRAGSIVFASSSPYQFGQVAPSAIPSNESGDVLSASKKDNYRAASRPLRLQEVVNYIKDVALKQSVKHRVFPSSEKEGGFYRREGNKIIKEKIWPSKVFDEGNIAPPFIAPLGVLGACGFQRLPIVMEQVDEKSMFYNANALSMAIWNRFMDIYRFTNDDGRFGYPNFQSEFCGFVSDDALLRNYGVQWPENSLAKCFTFKPLDPNGCGRIIESDIMLNPKYRFTNDPEVGLIGGAEIYLTQPTIMHELGHSWGEQIDKFSEEQSKYKYDYPSVMHLIYRGIMEDGRGLHAVDAFLIRRIYGDQTSIIPIKDVGVESYYATSKSSDKQSLFNASVDRENGEYAVGQEITFQNITVENNSSFPISNLQLRIFLSPTRALSPNAYEVSNYWYWPTFPAEDLKVDSYKTTLPRDIPLGTYYVVPVVTIDGDKADDFTFNNITSFYSTIKINKGLPPKINAVSVVNKTLEVSGENFSKGSLVRVDGKVLVTSNSSSSPNTTLLANLVGKLKRGTTITIQVENMDGGLSNQFSYTQPK